MLILASFAVLPTTSRPRSTTHRAKPRLPRSSHRAATHRNAVPGLTSNHEHLSRLLKATATASDPPQAAPVLPTELHELGVRVFGSEEALATTVSAMQPALRQQALGQMFEMVQAPGDSSLPGSCFRHTKPLTACAIEGYGFCSRKSCAYTEQKAHLLRGVALDIGANLGDLAILIHKLEPRSQVVAVEASPHTHFFLLWNLHLNGVRLLREDQVGDANAGGGVLPLLAAVSDVPGTVEMRWSDQRSQNAVIRRPDEHVTALEVGAPIMASSDTARASIPAGWHSAMVPTMNIPSWLRAHGVETVSLLKLDCEGCEFTVVPAWASFFSNKTAVPRFTGEFHWRALDRTAGRFQARPTDAQVAALEGVLRGRGCGAAPWKRVYEPGVC